MAAARSGGPSPWLVDGCGDRAVLTTGGRPLANEVALRGVSLAQGPARPLGSWANVYMRSASMKAYAASATWARWPGP